MAFHFLTIIIPLPLPLSNFKSLFPSSFFSPLSNPYPNANLFGPSNPGVFDFTLLFEDIFFLIIPALVFLVAAMGRIW